MFPHMPTATWREAGGIYCAVTEDAMNLHRISKDLISDHEVVPVVPVGPDYTYGYSPAPAYGGYYVVP